MATPVEPRPDLTARIARLFVYPIKSCAGIEVRQAALADTGLDLDRAWMVVDAQGEFVSQRELPRMALIRPTLRLSDLVLRAPGMLALHVSIDGVEEPCRVRVWNDEVPAFDMGDIAAQWFTDFLGTANGPLGKLRLVRFDPEHNRVSDRKWTGEDTGHSQFADGYAVLVISSASIDEFNRRHQARGQAAVGIDRFRPNIVLEGLDEAHDEDRADVLHVRGDDGRTIARLKLVKPCTRCSIPDVDPATADTATAVTETLQTYRANPVVGGGLTFGMNAIVLPDDSEAEVVLRVGQAVAADFRF